MYNRDIRDNDNTKEKKMELVNEYMSIEELRSWVESDGLGYVAYRLWDDEYYGVHDEEEIAQEIVRLLGL